MNSFITILAYVFDLFIIASFFNKILGSRKEEIKFPFFIGCLILVEIILYINGCFTSSLSPNLSIIITTIVSLSTTFALTFLYHASIAHKIFVTISFQIFAALGETFFTLAMQRFNPSIFDIERNSLIILMNLGSKIVLYLLVLLCGLFWAHHIRKHTLLQYNILLFSTPIISLIIIISLPLQDIIASNNHYFFLLLFVSLTLLNIVNYILLERILHLAELDMKSKTLEQQIQYQKDKYIQLGAAYKSNRSILHDTKKHYFTISEFVKHKEYDKLQDYLHLSMESMENTYASVNTGNLVIDSFVSTFKNVAKNNSICFEEDISVDANRIPINDYDLCVILGNLLDNCLNACMKIEHGTRFIKLNIYINDNDTFLIHTKNTYVDMPFKKERSFENSLKHGYGLDNIKNIVELYHGMFKQTQENYYDILIVIPIIDQQKRLHPIN